MLGACFVVAKCHKRPRLITSFYGRSIPVGCKVSQNGSMERFHKVQALHVHVQVKIKLPLFVELSLSVIIIRALSPSPSVVNMSNCYRTCDHAHTHVHHVHNLYT